MTTYHSRIAEYAPALDVKPDAMFDMTNAYTGVHYQYIYRLRNGYEASVIIADSHMVYSSRVVIGGTYEVAIFDGPRGDMVDVDGVGYADPHAYLMASEIASLLLRASAMGRELVSGQ